jgi:predicted HD phosphohydrolase
VRRITPLEKKERLQRLFALLAQLEKLEVPEPVNQLEHSLQVATRAWHSRAPLDLVLGALMHDVGRVFRPKFHGLLSAELIQPFVSEQTYWVVRIHDHLMLQYIAPEPGLISEADLYLDKPWYPAARIFAEDWDRNAFSSHACALPIEFFKPLLYDFCLNELDPLQSVRIR